MVSNINGSNIQNRSVNNRDVNQHVQEKSGDKDRLHKTQSSDTVTLSSDSILLKRVEDKIGAPVDEKKIAQLKESIENGTYNIDPDKIANKLIDQELLLSL
jgi:negative regulator of flagellin synthesis FlgM